MPVALGGTFLGLVATVPAVVAFGQADVRWLRLGKLADAVLIIVLFGTGPVVAILIALLVLSLV